MLFSLRNQGRLREAMALARDHVIPGSSSRVVDPAARRPHAGHDFAGRLGRPRRGRPRLQNLCRDQPVPESHAGIQGAVWHLDAGARRNRPGRGRRYGRGPPAGRQRASRSGKAATGAAIRACITTFAACSFSGGTSRRGRRGVSKGMFSTSDGFTRINLEMGRSLVALGRGEGGHRHPRPALRGGVDGGNSYVAHTELHEALAQAWAGQAIRQRRGALPDGRAGLAPCRIHRPGSDICTPSEGRSVNPEARDRHPVVRDQCPPLTGPPPIQDDEIGSGRHPSDSRTSAGDSTRTLGCSCHPAEALLRRDTLGAHVRPPL